MMFDKKKKDYCLEKSLKINFKSRKFYKMKHIQLEFSQKKLILASKVLIDEEEIVDYMIKGIPNKTIKH